MALQRSYELDTGVTADYWRITALSFSTIDRAVSITVSLYLNEAAKTGGKTPVHAENRVFSGEDYFAQDSALETTNIIAHAYTFLKTLAFFSSAVDV
jgi:hypothetical protein